MSNEPAKKRKKRKPDYAVGITGTNKGPWYDFLNSSEGKASLEPSMCLAAKGPYLENRLWRAFVAGLKSGFEQGRDLDK